TNLEKKIMIENTFTLHFRTKLFLLTRPSWPLDILWPRQGLINVTHEGSEYLEVQMMHNSI
ncbi:MAG: hypothetical protein AB2693_01145, partial [Candidatus Thiodiazotropha sp.]